MSEDRDVTAEYDRAQFVAQLRRLADVLEGGDASTFQIEGEDVSIPEDALFWVCHEREDGEVELEFQVTWSLLDSPDEQESETDSLGSDNEGDARD